MSNLAWLEINLSNLKSNIKNLKYLTNPETNFMAVVKSNAYGHGMVRCAEAAVEGGANWLGVVSISEALVLRENGIKTPILVLGYPELSEVQSASQHDISIPVTSLDYAKRLADIRLIYRLKVHLKIETGTNRLGMSEKEALESYKILYKNKRIFFEGIYSHLAASEENLQYTRLQIKQFQGVIDFFKKNIVIFPFKHLSSSAAMMILPEGHLDMVRCGIAIYGLWPSREIREAFSQMQNSNLKSQNNSAKLENDSKKLIEANEANKLLFLRPVLSYKTRIVQVKKVKKGETIGYGCSYQAKRNMVIGIIPVGYHEGIDRRLSSCGEVLFDGQRCRVVGRVCMNMSIIDISQIKNYRYKVGEEVVIIGKQGSEEIIVDEIAEKIGTINYEVVTRIPEHIPRVYKS